MRHLQWKSSLSEQSASTVFPVVKAVFSRKFHVVAFVKSSRGSCAGNRVVVLRQYSGESATAVEVFAS